MLSQVGESLDESLTACPTSTKGRPRTRSDLSLSFNRLPSDRRENPPRPPRTRPIPLACLSLSHRLPPLFLFLSLVPLLLRLPIVNIHLQVPHPRRLPGPDQTRQIAQHRGLCVADKGGDRGQGGGGSERGGKGVVVEDRGVVERVEGKTFFYR
jgi:hypothetical protein